MWPASTGEKPDTVPPCPALSDSIDAISTELEPIKSVTQADDKSATGSRDESNLCEQKQLSPEDPFYVDDLPKLEEFIPEEYFPDTLLVYDTDPNLPLKYKRVLPEFPRDLTPGSEDTERVARLHTHPANMLGTGHHSDARRGALTLPEPLYGRSRTGQVTVAVKTAQPRGNARRLLRNEAYMYSRFPRHLQQEYCGYELVRPIWHPVPVGPVVPKFYGYYVPVDEHGKATDRLWSAFSDREDGDVLGLSAILLLEECGQPVDPETFSADERCVRARWCMLSAPAEF